ncbi:MAG: phosphopantothenoylcysteine decarboxylase [Victivallaceae bacterium]|nr:phosphopantothenoylcysteine decarboxylase [Victivallaceae bacterium]
MKIVITAGGTREKIDAVRFITNRSTGKMGYAIAEAAAAPGRRVVLISAPTALAAPAGVEFIAVESAAEMAEAVRREAVDARLVIMAAAVADYRPKTVMPGKFKKREGNWVLELERTEDILASLGQSRHPGQVLVGFAAETDDLLANAAGKLERKNLDWIAANDVSRREIGFGSDNNAITLLGRGGRKVELGFGSKRELAEKLLQTVLPRD